ncbi:DUF3318 domain-containing protein [Burkholderia sp. Bp8963]|uniref:DUF3318 domain-containing protein n=1 Tax=Burkholderia sp. Bp8963 TaxID=2184547 RepID=UPI000F59C933|nr:DUF3318 domain-containing protein [Burkholderia sp. Bp8963]RQS70066.1 DUF3318 domain-containing protein [Burkholderia sp. Bp8963]
MNQNATGNRYRPSSSYSRLSAAQNRAIRKELLILRSEVERLEFAQAGAEMRQSVTHFRWLKVFVPGFTGGSFSQSAKNLNASVSNLFNQYPMLSSLVSIVLAKPVRSLLLAGAGPALKWGSLGFAAWEIYRFMKQSRDEREQAAANDD